MITTLKLLLIVKKEFSVLRKHLGNRHGERLGEFNGVGMEFTKCLKSQIKHVLHCGLIIYLKRYRNFNQNNVL